MNKHSISVVVTTYNRKYEVRRALESIYMQTEKPTEIILIDDCSNDGTEEYIKSFDFVGLKYYKMAIRSGPGDARNYGVKKAKGEYIAFLDSDNEWECTKLKEFSNIIRDDIEKYDVIYSMYKQHVNFGVEILPKKKLQDADLFRNEIWFGNLIDASSAIYKKTFLEEIGGFSKHYLINCDWELLLRGCRKRKLQVKKVDKVLTENWEMHDSLSEDKELAMKERRELLLEYAGEIMNAITEKSKRIEKEYRRECEHFEMVERQYRTNIERKDSFYQLMCKWLQDKIEGKTLAGKIKELGYKKIAIYGAGRHGMMFYKDIQGCDIDVDYFIDQNKNILVDKRIISLSVDEELPEVDAIIITPYMEYSSIRKELENKCNYNILSLKDLVER